MKTAKKLMEENIELAGALRAFGRLNLTIDQMEQQLQMETLKGVAYFKYAESLGGTEEGFTKYMDEQTKDMLAKQQLAMKKQPGKDSVPLGSDGKPMTKGN